MPKYHLKNFLELFTLISASAFRMELIHTQSPFYFSLLHSFSIKRSRRVLENGTGVHFAIYLAYFLIE